MHRRSAPSSPPPPPIHQRTDADTHTGSWMPRTRKGRHACAYADAHLSDCACTIESMPSMHLQPCPCSAMHEYTTMLVCVHRHGRQAFNDPQSWPQQTQDSAIKYGMCSCQHVYDSEYGHFGTLQCVTYERKDMVVHACIRCLYRAKEACMPTTSHVVSNEQA